MMPEMIPEEFLEVDDDDNWKPCLRCGGILTQVRKALFTCLNCDLQVIGDEEDMRP